MHVDYGNVLRAGAGWTDSYMVESEHSKDPFVRSYVTRYGKKDMVTLELAYNVALGRYLKDPKMIWNVSVVAKNHLGVDCPYPYGLITQDETWPMTLAPMVR